MTKKISTRATFVRPYLSHIGAFDRHFVGVSFGEDMRSGVAFTETDFIRFSFCTDDLVKRIHIWIQDFSYFDSHWNITNKKTSQQWSLTASFNILENFAKILNLFSANLKDSFCTCIHALLPLQCALFWKKTIISLKRFFVLHTQFKFLYNAGLVKGRQNDLKLRDHFIRWS